jgi:hypothetical protein
MGFASLRTTSVLGGHQTPNQMKLQKTNKLKGNVQFFLVLIVYAANTQTSSCPAQKSFCHDTIYCLASAWLSLACALAARYSRFYCQLGVLQLHSSHVGTKYALKTHCSITAPLDLRPRRRNGERRRDRPSGVAVAAATTLGGLSRGNAAAAAAAKASSCVAAAKKATVKWFGSEFKGGQVKCAKLTNLGGRRMGEFGFLFSTLREPKRKWQRFQKWTVFFN